MKKTIVKLALGAVALATAAMSVPSGASAGTFSDLIYQSGSAWFYHGSVSANVWGGIRSTRLTTYTANGNSHAAWLYTNCVGQPFKAVGGQFSGGNSVKAEYFCPNSSQLSNAQGYINDN